MAFLAFWLIPLLIGYFVFNISMLVGGIAILIVNKPEKKNYKTMQTISIVMIVVASIALVLLILGLIPTGA